MFREVVVGGGAKENTKIYSSNLVFFEFFLVKYIICYNKQNKNIKFKNVMVNKCPAYSARHSILIYPYSFCFRTSCNNNYDINYTINYRFFTLCKQLLNSFFKFKTFELETIGHPIRDNLLKKRICNTDVFSAMYSYELCTLLLSPTQQLPITSFCELRVISIVFNVFTLKMLWFYF